MSHAESVPAEEREEPVTNVEKLQERWDQLRANGLQDFKIQVNPSVSPMEPEPPKEKCHTVPERLLITLVMRAAAAA